MVFTLNGTVTLTFDLWTSESRGVIYWPWPIFLPSTMTVTHKFFKILSGHDVSNGRTDRQTDECHTIIRPKFLFGRIKIKVFRSCQSMIYEKAYHLSCFPHELLGAVVPDGGDSQHPVDVIVLDLRHSVTNIAVQVQEHPTILVSYVKVIMPKANYKAIFYLFFILFLLEYINNQLSQISIILLFFCTSKFTIVETMLFKDQSL